MAGLVALEPPGLRRILKAGLRQGIADPDLKQLIRDTFADGEEGSSVSEILQVLEGRGWLVHQDGRWKTKLG